MPGEDWGYIRVSSVDQNPDRQLDGVTLDKTFTDKVSGGSRDRPELKRCLDLLRENDRLHVHSIDRLARNLSDLEQIVSTLTGKGVNVHFHKENLVFDGSEDLFKKAFFQMLGVFAEFERSMIKERQREGIAKAKAEGKQIGAPPALSHDQIQEIKKLKSERVGVSELAKKFNVSRTTIYKVIKVN